VTSDTEGVRACIGFGATGAKPSAPPDDGTEKQALRMVSRLLPTGVVVLTATHEGIVHGATASTVSVVSQRPLILCASLRRSSLLARLAVCSGSFAVSVLTAWQSLLADWFANPERPPGSRQFGPIRWEPDEASGLPLLRDALAHLVCRVKDCVPVGEADGLLLGEILRGSSGHGRPLLGFDGRLHDAELLDVVRRQRGSPAGQAVTAWE
jgi:flavin reductase (DIM6/NTAB) family NADH-FMN oxidoreductase RutF